MHNSFKSLSHARYLTLVLAIFIFSATSVALAAIVSGSFTTNQSNDVKITQLSIDKPVGVAVGDLELANITVNGGSPAVVSAPAGWTQILRTDNDTNVSVISYYHIASISEPANYTWNISPQTSAEGGITRYSGVDASNPIDTSSGNIGFGHVATTSSITTNFSNEEIVTLYGVDVGKSNNANSYFTAPAGMVEKYDVSNIPFGPSTASDDAIQVSAGSSGINSSTISGNKDRNWVAQAIALRMFSPLSNNIISYWKFDESTGNASDSVGGNTLTSNNGSTFGIGKINNAAYLSASSMQYMSKVSPVGVTSNSDFTVNIWVYLNTLPLVNTEADLVTVWSGTPSNRAWFIGLDNQSGIQKLDVGTGDGVSTGEDLVDWAPNISTWYMVTLVYTKATHQAQFYVNGVAQGAVMTGLTDINTSSASPLSIGNRGGGNNYPTYLDGRVDETGYWNRSLSNTEIATLYNSGNGLQYPF